MTNHPIATEPPSERITILEEKFYETFATQSDHLDKLGQQLISLELAIPGLYATVLKLVSGDKASISPGWDTYLAFGCWLIALVLTLVSLIPRDYQVDTTVVQRDTTKLNTPLGIQDFFTASAKHKRKLIIWACGFFFAGIASAALIAF